MLTVRVSGGGAREKANTLLNAFKEAGLPYESGHDGVDHGGVAMDGDIAMIKLRINSDLMGHSAMKAVAPHIRMADNTSGIFSPAAKFKAQGAGSAVLELTTLD